MNKNKKYGQSTIPIHGGSEGKHSQHHPVNVPVYLSSTFAFPTQAEGAAIFNGESDGYTYSRLANPTVVDTEKRLALLENADDTALFSSGMGAINTTLTTLLKSGDHVIADFALYGGTHSTMTTILPKNNIEVTRLDTSDIEAIKSAIKENTKLIYFETPTNPTMKLVAIKPIVELAKSHNLITVIDATFMSPILMKPLDLGIDIVVHSVTKYLNGHSDILGGAVSSRAEIMEEIKMGRVHTGSIMDPFSAYLLNRGMKTLKIRMQAHEKNAMAIANYLRSKDEIKKLSYIGHKEHPGHEIALEQQGGFSSMMSFELKGDYDTAVKFVDQLELVTRAVSLGGVETLLSHPASSTHCDLVLSKEDREAAGVTDTLIRLSVGIEDLDDIKDDFEQAFVHLKQILKH